MSNANNIGNLTCYTVTGLARFYTNTIHVLRKIFIYSICTSNTRHYYLHWIGWIYYYENMLCYFSLKHMLWFTFKLRIPTRSNDIKLHLIFPLLSACEIAVRWAIHTQHRLPQLWNISQSVYETLLGTHLAFTKSFLNVLDMITARAVITITAALQRQHNDKEHRLITPNSMYKPRILIAFQVYVCTQSFSICLNIFFRLCFSSLFAVRICLLF